MKITPLDIRKQEFKKAFRGYNREEVEAFLGVVADELERMNRENSYLQERVRSLESSLEKYKHLESALQDTLITAQKTADETRGNARKEAELIVKEAELKAEQWIDNTRDQVNRIKGEITELKNQRDIYIARLRSLLNSQMEILNAIERDEYEATESPQATEHPSLMTVGGEEPDDGTPEAD